MLYEGLGWEAPKFAHMPLLRNADRSKISKRKNNTSIKWYREEGYLPEAMVNFLALMGWSMPDGSEIFTYEDVEREFTFERVTTSGPVFDLVKLTAINGKYIRALSDEELYERLLPFLTEDLDRDMVRAIVPVIKDRLTTLAEFTELTGFFFKRPGEYDAAALVPKKGTPESALQALERARDVLAGMPEPWTQETWEEQLRALSSELEMKAGDLFMVLRVAVTGSSVSPPLFESMAVLGKAETLARIDGAVDRLKAVSPA
jgi:glutamyl-tRNA synthetase